MKRLLATSAILGAMLAPATAQVNFNTVNASSIAAAANTFQLLLAAGTPQRSITIQNNNGADTNTNGGSADVCRFEITGAVAVGDTLTTAKTIPNPSGGTAISTTAGKISFALVPYGSYGRYAITLQAGIPHGPVVFSCPTIGDSAYADSQ